MATVAVLALVDEDKFQCPVFSVRLTDRAMPGQETANPAEQ
jgi:hypothetical protein